MVLAAREGGPFADLADFCQRTRLPRGLVQNAIRAGACDPFGPRRTLLWEAGGVAPHRGSSGCGRAQGGTAGLEEDEALAWEHELMGFSTAMPPMPPTQGAMRGAGPP